MEIGIVGAGIAGLAASIRSAVAGHKVTVFKLIAILGGHLLLLKTKVTGSMQVHPFLLCLNM